MPRVIEITDTGVNAMSLAGIQAELIERFKAKLGQDLSLSEQTPQMQIIGIMASITAEVTEAIVEDVNANSIDRAGDALLTDLGSILNIERVTATRSRVTATLTGVAGTGVPAGSQARTDSGDIFETIGDAVLSPTGVEVDMQAIEIGPVQIDSGTLTTIVTVIPGWETITNANAGAVGRSEQSDNDYRLIYQARTGRLAAGAGASIIAAISEAGATGVRIEENPTNSETTEQQFHLYPHSLIVVVTGAADGDIRRSIETRRGQGVGTMTAIRGTAPDNSNLDSVNNGRIMWAGVEFTGLNLTSAGTAADKAAALNTLLSNADPAVRIESIDGRYVAMYAWKPGNQPTFANGSSGSVAVDFGLSGAPAAPGPYIRTRERALTVSATVSRRTGFPADGLTRIRTGINNVVDGYGIGDEVWSNDILTAIEAVPGTRVTSLTVQYNGVDASGADVPLDAVWTLPAANLEVTIT